ncbi:MAG: PGPGW domain-containing protein [Porticoccus sp.]
MLDWLSEHQNLLTWLSVISLITFVGSLVALPWMVSMIPEDYFLHSRRNPAKMKQRHPVIRLLLLLGKNLLGLLLLCGGLLMLFLPGQGLLTIAVGLLLLDYPGKYTLERRIVAKKSILKGLNWLRAKAKHPPLKVDHH